MDCARRGRIGAILTRRASEGPEAFPSLARRVGVGYMQSDGNNTLARRTIHKNSVDAFEAR